MLVVFCVLGTGDVCTERHSALIVPYDSIVTHAVSYGEFRVACLEHLFALKLEAYRDRCESVKGQKDARDLVRIALIAGTGNKRFDSNLTAPCLGDQHVTLLQRTAKGPEIAAMARGNSKTANQPRRYFEKLVAEQVRLQKESG